MASFAEQIAQYAQQEPLDPDSFLQQMWPNLSPSQQELFSSMLAVPQNVRRDVAVQGGQGNLIDNNAMGAPDAMKKPAEKKGATPTTQAAPRFQYAGNFVPSGVSAVGAISGQAPGTSSSGWTNKISDSLTIRDVKQADGSAKFENVQTGNEVQIQPDSKGTTRGGYAEVGQVNPAGAGAQTFSGVGGTSTIASTSANFQSPIKQRIKLRSGEWLDVG